MTYTQNKPFLLIVSFTSTIIILLADFLAGSDIRVFVFYYLLIYLITYNLGGKWGLAFLLLSITGSLGINLAFPPPGVPAAAKYWNALIRLIVLGLTVQLTSRLIYTLEHEKALNSQLLEKIDEVNQTNKELHNLNYSIAHDVKNPLMIISSFCDILKEAQPQFNSEQNDALDHIISSTQRANDVVNDILRLSKVGSQELRLTDVNLSDITQISVEEFKRIYSAIKYKISIQPQMVIKADPGLVRILMDNLIGNAMKFSMKSNSPEIEIGKVKHNGEDVYYVKDNGVGLDKDKSGKIFEPFVRLHSSRDFPGTGVGLAIVNKIIQKHNGKIWISSEPGKGTTFYFVLSAP